VHNIAIQQVYTLCCAHHKCSCHHAMLLQYHCLYSLSCTYHPSDWLIPYLEAWNNFNVFLYDVTLKPISVSCSLNGSFTHAWLCYICMGDNCFTELCRFPSVGTFIMQYQKFTILDIIIILSEKSVLSTGKLSRSWWRTHIFQNSNLHLKAWVLSLSTNATNRFPWNGRLP